MSFRGYQGSINERSLPQEQAFQCDLLVWRNAPGLGAQDHPGHAAVVVRRTVNSGPWHVRDGRAGRQEVGPLTPALEPAEFRYVSFWPGSRGEAGNFSARSGKFRANHLEDMEAELGANGRRLLDNDRTQPRDGQIVIGTYDNGADVWGRCPQAVVPVMGLSGARADKLGLSLNRIVAWAARFRQGNEFNYVFASKDRNCAGVAVQSMRAGGGDAFAQLGGNPAEPVFYIVPNDAQRWANAVRLGVGECNRMLEVLRNRTAHMREFLVSAPKGLMSVQEWKTKSDVAWTIRGRMTAAIDKALKEYHEKDWETGFPKKLKALVTIIKNVHDHLRQESKRDSAYVQLASQIMTVVAELARSASEPWTPDDYYGDPFKRHSF